MASWSQPSDIKAACPGASIVKKRRVILSIAGSASSLDASEVRGGYVDANRTSGSGPGTAQDWTQTLRPSGWVTACKYSGDVRDWRERELFTDQMQRPSTLLMASAGRRRSLSLSSRECAIFGRLMFEGGSVANDYAFEQPG